MSALATTLAVEVWPLVVADMQERWPHSRVSDKGCARDAQGRAQYGVPLTPDTVDNVREAELEALDLCAYLKAACLKAPDNNLLHLLYEQALWMAQNLHREISARDGVAP